VVNDDNTGVCLGARRERAEHISHRGRGPVMRDAAQEEHSDGRGLRRLWHEEVVRLQHDTAVGDSLRALACPELRGVSRVR
jgi:hypothetical protein